MAIPPHLRRLQADQDKLRKLQQLSRYIDIYETEGSPPEKYTLHLTCKGIREVRNGAPVYSESFYLGIFLAANYPTERPLVQVLVDQTPVWHPNIAQNGLVCYGDEGDHGWSPASRLDDLVIRVVEMLRYENVGFESPFNGNASAWAAKNQHLFPIDTRQILDGDLTDDVVIDDSDLDIVIVDEDQPGTSDANDMLDQIQIL